MLIRVLSIEKCASAAWSFFSDDLLSWKTTDDYEVPREKNYKIDNKKIALVSDFFLEITFSKWY